jgi:hypothetical protein
MRWIRRLRNGRGGKERIITKYYVLLEVDEQPLAVVVVMMKWSRMEGE